MSKYNNNLFESIKDSLNKKSKNADQSSAFKDILKLEKGKTYIVRLIPNVESFDKTFFNYYSHTWTSRINQNLINVFCPNSYGDRCPIDEYRSKIWKSGTEEQKNDIRPLKRNENWMVNVYVIKDPTNPENQGKIKILRYGKQLAKIINDAISGDESDEFGPKIFDLSEKGCNLKIKVEENEGGYATYVSSRFQSPSAIEGLENPDDVYDKVFEFETMFKHQSYDEIESIFQEHWFGNVKVSEKKQSSNSSSPDDDDEFEKPSFSKKVKTDDDDDDDDDDELSGDLKNLIEEL